MDVLFDGKIWAMQRAGGINRYFANLISRLPEDCNPTLTTRQELGVNAPAHSHLRIKPYHPFRPHRISRLLEKAYFRSLERVHQYHVAHPTYYSLLTQQEFNCYRCPVVVTVYDMIHELFPQNLQTEDERNVWRQKKQAVERADAILCISENTRRDLIALYPQVEAKTVVTYLATEMDLSFTSGTQPVPERPYFLFVGGRSSYKNFDGLLTSLSQITPRYPDVLVCVVGSAFSEAEQNTIASLGLTDHFLHYGSIDDRHLAKLYRHSLALVYPSRYEGFGIPPLEAMACETIVVGANVSSVPEVVGRAGLLFDPDSDELTDILLALLAGAVDRGDFIQRGRQRAGDFHWDKTTAQTVAVYRKIAG
jgi:glycosyltransferase involved in cell wall biosynthesis